MPSLSDALEDLAAHSKTLHNLSARNTLPSGPFTHAYLREPTLPNLIRDALESEARLFKFVGQVEPAGSSSTTEASSSVAGGTGVSGPGIEAGPSGAAVPVGGAGGLKRVEKRDGEVTPLREMRLGRGKGGKEDVEAVLQVTLKLMDDYRPMPRARAHITSLIEQHRRQVDRIAELELLIAEATSGGGGGSTLQPAPSSPSPAPPAGAALKTKKPARPKMSIDDALKAEEAALRELEAETRALKASMPAAQEGQDESATASASTSSPPRRTITTLDQYGNPISTARTPGRTPRAPGSIGARSLFQGPPGSTGGGGGGGGATTTPGRSRASLVSGEDGHAIDRFSPLKLLSTPRTAQRASLFGTHASLRKTARPSEGRFLFTKPMPTPVPAAAVAAPPRPSLYASVGESTTASDSAGATPVAASSEEVGAKASAESHEEDDDQTVRFGQYHSTEGEAHAGTPQAEQDTAEEETVSEGETYEDEPEPSANEDASAKVISGVEVELPGVEIACDRIITTLPDLVGQGLPPGSGPRSVVKHLHDVSTSSLPAPPSPSSSSTHSALAGAAPVPPPVTITQHTVLLAHLMLILLRAFSVPDEAAGGVALGWVGMDDVKAELASVADQRGWDDGPAMAQKVIYAAKAQRACKIDFRTKRVACLE